MKIRNRIRSVAAVAAATALTFVLMPAGGATARGYISDPMSRHAQCAAGIVECGGIKREPQSGACPKGLRSCSGGNGRLEALHDDNCGGDVSEVSTPLSCRWSTTAAHSTSNWEYFSDGYSGANCEDNGARPPSSCQRRMGL